MNVLMFIFGFMVIYGFVKAKFGVVAISACMIFLVNHGKRELRKRDIEFWTSPRSAKKPKSGGTDALSEQECESSRDKL